MKLEEAIKHAEEVAEANEKVINTGMFEDGTYVSELYADDTECIEECLARCDKCANEHRQLAGWLKDYKRLLEQEPVLDKIREEIEAKCCITVGRENDGAITLYDVFEIIDKYKAEIGG